MKIVLTGGGTSGHVNPALAIMEIIKKKYPDTEFLFIGREGGDENKAVNKAMLPLKTLSVTGLPKRVGMKLFKALRKAMLARTKSKRILKEYSPELVIGTGGYVCWPVLSAAHSLGIKTAIHESNAHPGLVTRMISKKCDVVMLNRKETEGKLKLSHKPYIVGNPLRSGFSEYSREKARKAIGLREKDLFVVSFGGSLGSETINKAILDLFASEEYNRLSVRHIHSSGRRYYEEIIGQNDFFSNNKRNFLIKPFIDNIPLYLAAADLAITRSGAITLSELAFSGTPAILIPSPNVTDDHQMKNALSYAKGGAARVISEEDLTSEALKQAVLDILLDKDKRQSMHRAAKRQIVKDSEEKILNALFQVSSTARNRQSARN